MNRSNKLGEKKIITLLLEFSIPAITGMLVNALYNVVVRIYVGQGVGTLGISALTIVFPVQLIVFGFVMLIGVGGASLISISLGKKNIKKAEHIVGNGFSLLALSGLIAGISGFIFSKQILIITGATTDNYEYAYSYLRIIFIFIIFQFIGYGLNSFIRSEGNPIRSMMSMIAGAVVNIILDPIFIFVFKMGVKGAAIATGISLFVTALWNMYYFINGKSLLKIKLKHLIPDFNVASSIIKIGLAPFFMQIIASTLNIVLNNQIKNYGGDLIISAQAAIGIIQGFNMIFFMPILGINMGSQPIIGYNYGAKKYDRVKKTLFYSIIGAVILASICFFISEIFPEYIYKSFNRNDYNLIEFGSKVMRIIMISFPILGFYVVSSNYFQAIGKPKHALMLGLSRPILFLIPLVVILPMFFGLTGIWISIPIADIGSSLLTTLFMILEFKRLNKKHIENSAILADEKT